MESKEININLNIQVQNGEEKVKAIPLPISSKLNVKCSVPQLAYFFRVLKEIGCIRNPNQADLFRFIAENLKTPKQQEISADSVKSKYYSPEDNTKELVKESLINMVNYINRN